MDYRNLDLNLLLALDALLSERNVTRAARRLNISQPALSAKLARLRRLFDDELMIPTSRGVLPTALALELQEPIRQVLDGARGIVSRGQSFDATTSDMTFCIAASDYMQIAVLLPFLNSLNSHAPRIRILLRALDPATLPPQLARGEVDVAFVLSGHAAATGLHAMDVLTDQYVGIARKGTLPDKAMSLDEFLLRRHIIVSTSGSGFVGATDIALAQLGLRRNVAFAVTSFLFLAEAVSQSDLVAMAPSKLAKRYHATLDTFGIPLEVPGFSVAMVWHEGARHHPAHIWLRDELAKYCRIR